MAITGAVYLLTCLSGGSENTETLLQFGASYAPLVSHGQYWRLIMPMFLHAGPIHLLLNMLVLYSLGAMAESLYGYGRFALIYVLSGIGGSLLSVSRSDSVAVGASGALMGVVGALIVMGWRNSRDLPPRLQRLLARVLPILAMVDMVSGWALTRMATVIPIFGRHVAGVDNWAHLGGLITGTVCALAIPLPRYRVFRMVSPTDLSAVSLTPRFQPAVLLPAALVVLGFAGTARFYRNSSQLLKVEQEAAHLEEGGHSAQAFALWQKAARLNPLDGRPHEQIGLGELKQGRTAEALHEYKQALALDPDSARAKLGLAMVYKEIGDYSRSKQLYESVLGKDPRDADGQVVLGILCTEQKLYAEAVRHYREALGFDQSLALAHNNLAWLYATSDDANFRDPRQALEHALAAVELTKGKQPEYLDTLAEAYYANSNYVEAVKIESQTLTLDSKNLEYQEHILRYRRAADAH